MIYRNNQHAIGSRDRTSQSVHHCWESADQTIARSQSAIRYVVENYYNEKKEKGGVGVNGSRPCAWKMLLRMGSCGKQREMRRRCRWLDGPASWSRPGATTRPLTADSWPLSSLAGPRAAPISAARPPGCMPRGSPSPPVHRICAWRTLSSLLSARERDR